MPPIKETSSHDVPGRSCEQPIIEGLTRSALESYLAPLVFSDQKKRRILKDIQTCLRTGTDWIIITAQTLDQETEWDYLISGPERYLVRGHGQTREAFQASAERLSFFLKPGYVRSALFRTQIGEGSSLPLTLSRDECYRYTDGNAQMILTASESTRVALSTPTSTYTITAPTFWGFVFGTEDLKAEISVSHAAQLLGLSTLTVRRRIGEGKLPAARAQSTHPGVTQAGIEEYLLYRRSYPQGCISPRQYERWKTWQAQWQQQYLPCRSLRLSPQE